MKKQKYHYYSNIDYNGRQFSTELFKIYLQINTFVVNEFGVFTTKQKTKQFTFITLNWAESIGVNCNWKLSYLVCGFRNTY